MNEDDTIRYGAPTRRDTIKYGGTVVGGGLLAGCTGDPTGDTSNDGDGEYSVTISPVGTVEFEEVPRRVLTYNNHYVDMAVACGHGEAIKAMGDGFYTGYYDQLPGVEFDPSTRVTASHDDKELIYQIDPDLILLDPTWYLVYSQHFDFDEDDIEEITDNVAPYFGNRFSRAHTETGIEDYEYYTAWELYGKVAQVFRETDRMQALERVRDELVAHIESNIPPEAERPTVGLVVMNDWAEFSPYRIDNEGIGVSQYRPLGVRDVFAESDQTYEQGSGIYDLESMLELDPDVLIHNFGVGGTDERYQSMLELGEDPVGSELSAVQNDRLYGGGHSLQGPIWNLFQMEMAAKQLYPEQFGAFPRFNDDGTYHIAEADQLFSRTRVSDIVNGEF